MKMGLIRSAWNLPHFSCVFLVIFWFQYLDEVYNFIGLQSESESSESDDSDYESYATGVSEYKRLIAIHAGKPKGGLKEALKVGADKVRRLSLSEKALKKATKSHGMDVIR